MISKNTKRVFVELSDSQLDPLIDESRDAFLGSKTKGTLTARELLRKFIGDRHFRAFGVVLDGKIVSYITILSHKGRSDARSIGPMYVSDKVQGLGIGTYQVQELIKYLRRRGVTTVFTKTWSENKRSRAVFESLGFEISSIIEGDRTNGDSTIEHELKK